MTRGQRNLIPALPFCHARLTARKPERPELRRQPRTWGERIRRHRFELRLLQREAAERIGCSEASVYNWERNRTAPRVSQLPRIIGFLGYAPSRPAQSFRDILRTYRHAAGLSQGRLARLARIDETTLAKWERGTARPMPATLRRLRRFFERHGMPMQAFGSEVCWLPRRAKMAHPRPGSGIAPISE